MSRALTALFRTETTRVCVLSCQTRHSLVIKHVDGNSNIAYYFDRVLLDNHRPGNIFDLSAAAAPLHTMAPTEQEFFSALQCIEDYLKTQDMLGGALKDGLLNLARGKYTLGSSLGQQRYPGDMRASALLQPCPAGAEDAIYEEFSLQTVTVQHAGQMHHTNSTAEQHQQHGQHEQQPEQETAGRTAAGAAVAAAGSESLSGRHACSSNDPLAWFSALPLQPVRQAQSDFAAALQHAVAAANALQRLRQLAADLGLQEEDAASDAS